MERNHRQKTRESKFVKWEEGRRFVGASREHRREREALKLLVNKGRE